MLLLDQLIRKHLLFKIFKRLLFACNADTVSNKGSVKQERKVSLILDEISLMRHP